MTLRKTKVRVTVSENGPYIVTGDIPLAKQTIVADAQGGFGSSGKRTTPLTPHSEDATLSADAGLHEPNPFATAHMRKSGLMEPKRLVVNHTSNRRRCSTGRRCSLPTPKASAPSAVSATRTVRFGVRWSGRTIPGFGRCSSARSTIVRQGRLVAHGTNRQDSRSRTSYPFRSAWSKIPNSQCSGPLWVQGIGMQGRRVRRIRL